MTYHEAVGSPMLGIVDVRDATDVKTEGVSDYCGVALP